MEQRPSGMDRATFIERFGGVFEHAPWIAAAAYDEGVGPDEDTAGGLHRRMVAVMRSAPRDRQLQLIRNHPDLAGRLALAGGLTPESSGEQRSAGLDHCSPQELARFQALNETYTRRFGFPFIMAVKGRSRAEILAAFERRVDETPEREFETALCEVEKIARLRLADLLPGRGPDE